LTKPVKEIIWVHAVSVGEVNAAIPLIDSMLHRYEDREILVTTSTLTGSNILLSKMDNKIYHQYLPVDIPHFLEKFISFWKPSILIILETEIWPNLIESCKNNEVRTLLVNARLSNKSLNSYKYIRHLISDAIKKLDVILTQYKSDSERFEELCGESLKIEACGNLKFDYEIPKELNLITQSIKDDWAIAGIHRPTLIAASTHEGEEEIILDSFMKILESKSDALLIVVPRHPERFDRVYKKIKKTNLVVAKRSLEEDISEKVNVLLGDTMGELNLLYSVSDIAFVGGSLVDHGGQNLLEPASLSRPICSGENLRNFQEISKELKEKNALKIIKEPSDLVEFFLELISEKELLKEKGNAANEVFIKNKGALEHILKKVDFYLT